MEYNKSIKHSVNVFPNLLKIERWFYLTAHFAFKRLARTTAKYFYCWKELLRRWRTQSCTAYSLLWRNASCDSFLVGEKSKYFWHLPCTIYFLLNWSVTSQSTTCSIALSDGLNVYCTHKANSIVPWSIIIIKWDEDKHYRQ